LEKQRNIADVLWVAIKTQNAYKNLFFQTEKLVQSRFIEMFGDPITNSMGWEVLTLKDIAIGKLSYGSGASASEFDNETRYIRITDITEDGSLTDDAVSASQFDEKYLLKDGDILFARSGSVGRTFRYSDRWGKCMFAGYLIKLTPNLEKVLPDYLYNYTKSDYYQEFITQNQKTVTIANINAQQYGNLTVCLPPLSLQNRFADFVRQADKSKFELQKAIYELDATYKSLLRECFR
ncbi:MAG: restriction endonuclease subunit S, partial [Deferribacteraceae bacterium]|nr:restriction endonuclease subunit S [Deferribacteraceae bacterium]